MDDGLTYDVIVVGGGPAGSTAAREAAQAGLRVALLDKAEFPRDKPCGGGLTVRCARLLPFDIAPVVERTIHGVHFSVRPATSFTQRSPEPITFLTQRRRLDAFLLDRAKDAGVDVREKTAVRAVEANDGGYRVKAGAHEFRGAVLVAADGANGVTSRLAGVETDRWKGIALEGNISTGTRFPYRWADTMGVDFTHSCGGYGWLFPKGDHVNIGVGGWQGGGPTLRQRLDLLTRDYGFDPAELWGLRGHPLPVRRPGAVVYHHRMVLVGDAAGFLDPFTGEGIFAAIWSGSMAVGRIVEFLRGEPQALEHYRDDVERELIPDLRVSRKLYDLFHLCPWLWTQGVRVPEIWALAVRLLRGEQTYSGASRSSSRASSALSLVYEALKTASRAEFSGTTSRSRIRPLYFAG